MELMVKRRFTREGDDPQHLRVFPKQNIVLMQYMLIVCWLRLLTILEGYFICPGSIEQVLVMDNNIIPFAYTYAKCRLNITPDIFYTLTHIGRLATWTSSRHGVPQERRRTVNPLRGKTEFLSNELLR